jgi:hypothetical protein
MNFHLASLPNPDLDIVYDVLLRLPLCEPIPVLPNLLHVTCCIRRFVPFRRSLLRKLTPMSHTLRPQPIAIRCEVYEKGTRSRNRCFARSKSPLVWWEAIEPALGYIGYRGIPVFL